MSGASFTPLDGVDANTDDIFDALSNARRRHVLHCLKAFETPMAVADLTDELLRRERDASSTAVEDEREKLSASLYHSHLPKLADAGLVSYDTDRKLVALREEADALPLDDVRARADDSPRETTDTDASEQRAQAVEHLGDALDADESAEKNFHIREALQLLTVADE